MRIVQTFAVGWRQDASRTKHWWSRSVDTTRKIEKHPEVSGVKKLTKKNVAKLFVSTDSLSTCGRLDAHSCSGTKVRGWFYLLFPVICLGWARTYSQDIMFQRQTIGFSEGLPSEKIYALSEDTVGNLYLATNKGVLLYDGYRFIPLVNSTSPIYNLVHSGNRFFGNSALDGIVTFKNIFDAPIVFRPTNFMDDNPDNDKYNNLYIDKYGHVWCSDRDHVKFFSVYGHDSASFHIGGGRGGKLADPKVFFCEPYPHQIWTIAYNGVMVYDNGTGKMSPTSVAALGNQAYSAAFLDGTNLYMAVNGGNMLVYHTVSRTVEYLSPLPGKENAQLIRTVDIKGRKRLLAATDGKLYLYMEETKNYQILYDAGNNAIMDLHVMDDLHIIWLATGKGLVKLFQPYDYLYTYRIPTRQPSVVRTVVEDSYGNLWAGAGNVLWQYDGDLWNPYPLPSDSTQCNSIFLWKDKPLISTNNGILLLEQGHLRKLPLKPENLAVKKAIVDASDRLWMILSDGSLKVYDMSSRSETNGLILNNDSVWHENECADIMENNDGKIWLAAWFPKDFGIAYYDAHSKRIVPVSRLNKNHSMFMGDSYLGVAKTGQKGELLFCGYGGWNRVSADGKLIRKFGTDIYKVSDFAVRNISQDALGNIWFATEEGLDIYNPVSNAVYQVSQVDGLPTNNLTNGYYQTDDRHLLLGVEDAVLSIDQQKILDSHFTNKLQLTAIHINGVLQPYASNTVKLEKGENDVEFDFSTLGYGPEKKVQYRYRFSNEQDWVSLGSLPVLPLKKLGFGDYNIEVEAGDNMGHWQPQRLTIALYVPTPFHKTWWFVSLVSLLSAALTFFVVYYFLVQQKDKYKLKIQIKDIRTQVLRAQMNPHFIFNVLNSIESYIVENDSRTASRLIQKFSLLCRFTLENSSQTTVNAEQEWEALKLYTEFEAMRFPGKFRYSFEVEDGTELSSLSITPMMVQPLIENAIHHGIRNSDKRDLQLGIQVQRKEDVLVFVVRNNGARLRDGQVVKSSFKAKSMGIAIIKERIDIINQTIGKKKASFSLSENDFFTVATLSLPILDKEDH
ncbi:MAG: histidine kinase [Chitinophagaceae bacterium]